MCEKRTAQAHGMKPDGTQRPYLLVECSVPKVLYSHNIYGAVRGLPRRLRQCSGNAAGATSESSCYHRKLAGYGGLG